MTERLSQLMHDEARDLDVPAPPTAEIAHRGRRVRRRQRVVTGAAALAVAAVVAVGAVVAGSLGDDTAREIGPVDAPEIGAAFASGNTVYLDDGQVSVRIDDGAVKSLYYTSAGVLVRHGDDAGPTGAQRFSLVTPTGDVQPVGVETELTVPGVDDDQPYLAYAVVTDGNVEVVVHDVATDTEVARVPVPGSFDWGGYAAPPVAIEGDTVYVGTDGRTRLVYWRTGGISRTDALTGPYLEVHGGRAVTREGGADVVVDATSGEVVDMIEGAGAVELSPDGRYAVFAGNPRNTTVRTLGAGAGAEVTVGGLSDSWGWTAEDDLFRLTADGVQVCAADTGECTTTALPGGVPADARLGGQVWEN